MGFLNPTIMTKFYSLSRNPERSYWPIPIPVMLYPGHDVTATLTLIAQNSIVFRDIYLQCEICDKSGIKKRAFSTGGIGLVN